ncbi:Predicted 3-hydroxylacyl-ACP dehydratase, HotDog domain [Modicisalibacter muralis]|uniref:Predicted 3-hydroxylacyl-ACP dehydratase, HotDog domain n=1 Tax=Modicisalibacter muralis TaxID=119000 RepID=A0A1G9HZH4_9GAMM|nr:hypothetical protein [Halomonas muralis]SDL18196.1 Predicted 3-hydroxylacyl-ACP dehydratase, HotDog domain [Halomonas muralis]
MTVHPEPSPALPCAIAPFVPQTQGMCLLDRIVAVGDNDLSAEITPSTEDVFARDDGIPGWVALEWLAQAVAAWAGWHGAQRGEPPAPGFLIGTRRFTTTRDRFAFGETLRVTVSLEFRADNGLGHFHGELHGGDGIRLAHGSLTVFQPDSNDDALDDNR